MLITFVVTTQQKQACVVFRLAVKHISRLRGVCSYAGTGSVLGHGQVANDQRSTKLRPFSAESIYPHWSVQSRVIKKLRAKVQKKEEAQSIRETEAYRVVDVPKCLHIRR